MPLTSTNGICVRRHIASLLNETLLRLSLSTEPIVACSLDAEDEVVGSATTVPVSAPDVLKVPAGADPVEQSAVAFRITREVFRQIRRTVGRRPAETGGMLGGNRENGIITQYCFDTSAKRSGATYSPDHTQLTSLLREQWNPRGVKLMGFVHSHPSGCRQPSYGDRIYAKDILDANEAIDVLFLPIVMSSRNGGQFELLPFYAKRDEQGGIVVLPARLDIIEHPIIATTDVELKPAGATPVPINTVQTFARVAELYDLPRLAGSRVISVGVGGAAGFLEDLARSGVGQFVLIDPDTVAEANIATQQVYRRDIGRPKVACVADRLRDINPNVLVECRIMRDDDIDDVEFQRLLVGSVQSKLPVQSLICGFTDSFPAQARVNRLALNFGIPSLCAQLYEGGSMLELTYTYPGLTQACHRCILATRYKAYLEDGYHNTIGSQGTPIFATGRLNALKGFVAMGLLHYTPSGSLDAGTVAPGTRWHDLLRQLDQRNLAWVRTDPSVTGAFSDVFGHGSNNIVFDETIWRVQTPDGPSTRRITCPDCGGTGNLLSAAGTFVDTRKMRLHPSSE